jgi:hypothetical protein
MQKPVRSAAVGGPNQVVSASASPSWVRSPIRRAEPRRRWDTNVFGVDQLNAICTRSDAEAAGLTEVEEHRPGIVQQVAKAAERRTHKPLPATEIALQVGKVLGRYKMRKHFQHMIVEGKLSWSRGTEAIADEARVDGIYVIRTSEAAEQLSAADTVRSYKSLAQVERAFRSLKGLDLLIAPFAIAPKNQYRHIFSYVRWLITWSGICERYGPPAVRGRATRRATPPPRSDSARPQLGIGAGQEVYPPHCGRASRPQFSHPAGRLSQPRPRTYSLKADRSGSTFQQVPAPTPLQAKAYELLNLLPPELAPCLRGVDPNLNAELNRSFRTGFDQRLVANRQILRPAQ